MDSVNDALLMYLCGYDLGELFQLQESDLKVSEVADLYSTPEGDIFELVEMLIDLQLEENDYTVHLSSTARLATAVRDRLSVRYHAASQGAPDRDLKGGTNDLT